MSSVMRLFGIHTPKPKLAGFSIQTSVYGLGIPIVYGRNRISGNIIHIPKQPVPVGGGGKGGGKGGSGGKGAAGGQNYVGPVAVALCEGPIAGVGYVWRDKEKKVDFAAVYQPNGWSLFLGSSSQSPWSYLSTNYPSEAVPYQFTAYVVNPAADFPNGQMSQFGWEIKGLLPFGGGIVDANPADILEDVLTDAEHGVGFPVASLGDLTLFSDYCAAAGLFASTVFDSQQPARDGLNELFEIGNSGAVWSDGLLKVVPFGDTPLSANGRTYTPNTAPIYDLGDNDFLRNSAASLGGDGDQNSNGDLDPILLTRIDPAKAFNQVTVKCRDRDYDYNTVPVPAQDDTAVALYGPIPLQPLDLEGVTTQPVARQVAQLRLQRELSVRNTYQFNLGWKYSLLEPMDLVTLTDAALGLSLTPVRIVSIDEAANEKGFTVIAEDWPFGIASATLYGTGSASGSSPDTTIAPGDTTAPLIFEGPRTLQSAPLEIWMGASGGDSWGGCEVWLSVDNVNFAKIGIINGKAAFGVTTASLATDAAYPAIDVTHTLAVNTTLSGRTLEAQTTAQFTNLIPLCYLGGAEFVAYRDLALTSAFHYDLTHLYRGLFDSTIPASHSSGVPFILCDAAILRFPWPLGYVGQVLYFKFPAFNIYGSALQQLSDVSSVSHTVGQDPVIPGMSTGPTLVVSVTPGNPSLITWMGTGDVEVSINGGAPAPPAASPISVTPNPSGGGVITYNFTAELNGQTIPASATIPELPFIAPSISGIAVSSIVAPGDGTGSFDIAWTGNDMPGGVTYNILFTLTHGCSASDPQSGEVDGVTSIYTLDCTPFGGIGPTGFGGHGVSPLTGTITIRAMSGDAVVATGVFPFSIAF